MKLYLLRLADMGGTPAAGYLVQTDDGTNVLIDSGFPREMIGSSEGWTIDEDQFVVNQLGQIGVAPEDVHYLVATHLDVDHAGAHDEFPSAEHVIVRASTRKLVELAHRENAALIVRGHDGAQWQGLRTLPGFYS